MGSIKYEKQVVAFLDLLGFSKLIESVEELPDLAIEKIRFISETINHKIKINLTNRLFSDDKLPIDEPVFKVFSDCICIASDCYEESIGLSVVDNVFTFLLKLIYIQAELSLNGIFLRGAVTINRHFQSDKIIFSSALVDSYKIESEQAIYPRIIIDEPITKLLRKVENPESSYEAFNALIKIDRDGLIFLDYLEYVDELMYEGEKINFFQEHRRIVEEEICKNSKPRVKEKYLWVAHYHNQKVKENYQDKVLLRELSIPEKLLKYKSSVFTIIYPLPFTSSKEGFDNGIFLVASDSFTKALYLSIEN